MKLRRGVSEKHPEYLSNRNEKYSGCHPSGQRPRKKHALHSKGRGRAWRTDRRGGARDLPRAQGEDRAELMRRMMSMISSRLARSSSADQNEPDGMLESDSE